MSTECHENKDSSNQTQLTSWKEKKAAWRDCCFFLHAAMQMRPHPVLGARTAGNMVMQNGKMVLGSFITSGRKSHQSCCDWPTVSDVDAGRCVCERVKVTEPTTRPLTCAGELWCEQEMMSLTNDNAFSSTTQDWFCIPAERRADKYNHV